MFFEVSKLLNLFISPITWIILLLIGSFLFKKKKYRKICLAGCIVVFILSTNNLLVEYVKYQTIKQYNTVDEAVFDRSYDLAVVMGGFGSMNKETGQLRYENDRADRLWEAVRLWRKGKVTHILISGDLTSVIEKDGSSTAGLFLDYMEEMGVPKDVFILERHSRNTRENALYTAEILKQKGIWDKNCLLITSATHMKRSLACFAKVGLHPEYLPVNTYDPPATINHRAFYPTWDAAMKWKELINEWIGEVSYRIMGYI